MATDLSGRVHVTWATTLVTRSRQNYDGVMYRSSLDGQTWSAPLDIVALPSKGAVTRATMLIDPGGLFHITFRSYSLFYARTSVNTVNAAQLQPARVMSTPDAAYFSRLTLDRHGRLHLVYTENVFDANCGGCFHAFHRWSDNAGLTWTEPVDITPLSTGVAKPQIVIDDQDNLQVVVETGRGGDLGQVPDPANVAYVASYDRGLTWATPRFLGVPDDVSSRHIALGQDKQKALVAAWLVANPERDVVKYAVSVDYGLTWSVPQVISDVWGAWTLYQGKTDGYMMTNDSAGMLYLTLVGRVQEKGKDLSVLVMRWDGASWLPPQAIITLSDDAPEWPRLAVSNGNQLNLVWFVRNKAGIFGDDRQYSVWYARGSAAAPALPALPWPTPASIQATPATPAAALVTPTPVMPTPTPRPAGAASGVNVYNEADYVLIAAASLAPVLALILGVIVFQRLRRR